MDRFISTLLVVISFGVSSAREVTVMPGPLIRVEGQPVSIECSVYDYQGPSEQDFDWVLEQKGKEVAIISTFEMNFSDAMLGDRIASGDISVARRGDNSVELRIKQARLSDSGTYICSTPSTDSSLIGNYKANVELIVIPDTLSVSSETPTPVVPEGSDITLSCSVTHNLTRPTYLSVAWSVRRGSASPDDILTFGPEGAVVAGKGYARRYADGSVRLAPGTDGTFALVVATATSQDGGTYVCTGREYAHESSGRWEKIVERSKDMGVVTVTPTAQSLSATTSPAATLLSPGDPLTLLCTVAADNLDLLALEVAWLANGREVVALDHNGVVVSNGSSPSSLGGAGLERTSAGEFRLTAPGVQGTDGGAYTCRVRAYVQRGRGDSGGRKWYMAAEKTSNAVTVKVAQIKPNFTLTLTPSQTPLVTSDPTEMACHVTNITHLPMGGRLAVAWQYTSLPGTGNQPQTSHPIGSLDALGNLFPGVVYSDRLASGAVTLTRVQPDTFKLRFLQTQEVDMGQYACTVSAWGPDGQGQMVKASEYQSLPLTVRWESKRPTVSVAAKRVREASVGGSTFEMSCTVANENLGEAGYSVIIQSQDSMEGAARPVMTMSPDSVLQYGANTDPSRRDSLVLTKTGPLEFRFRLAGVQLSDRGFYWCNVTAWTRQPGQTWTRAASGESNRVRIDFQENGPSFSIALDSNTASVYPLDTAKMTCSLSVSGSSPKIDDLAYEVHWFFSGLQGGRGTPSTTGARLASVDRFGVVRMEGHNSSSDLSLQRRDTHTYVLNIHAAQDGDSGGYQCTATPWYLSASTGAWTQAGVLTSAQVFLSVRMAVWDSLKLPLLYGASASLAVGLFSLVLGVVCAHCCCRNTAHTPRSRNHLMDLDMD